MTTEPDTTEEAEPGTPGAAEEAAQDTADDSSTETDRADRERGRRRERRDRRWRRRAAVRGRGRAGRPAGAPGADRAAQGREAGADRERHQAQRYGRRSDGGRPGRGERREARGGHRLPRTGVPARARARRPCRTTLGPAPALARPFPHVGPSPSRPSSATPWPRLKPSRPCGRVLAEGAPRTRSRRRSSRRSARGRTDNCARTPGSCSGSPGCGPSRPTGSRGRCSAPSAVRTTSGGAGRSRCGCWSRPPWPGTRCWTPPP